MAEQQSATSGGSQEPIDKAIGLLAACFVVVFGGWAGLQPETILMRSIVVGGAVFMLVRLVMSVLNSIREKEDE